MAGIRLWPPASTRASPPALHVRERFVDRSGAEVFEGSGDHGQPPVSSTWTRPTPARDTPSGIRLTRPVRERSDGTPDGGYTADMVSAVVLAAGASTRMGTPKLLLPLGGEPIVRRTARQLCDSGSTRCWSCRGRSTARSPRRLRGCPSVMALNPDFATGMGSSFRTGVEHLPATVRPRCSRWPTSRS